MFYRSLKAVGTFKAHHTELMQHISKVINEVDYFCTNNRMTNMSQEADLSGKYLHFTHSL
jgi:hypothetical protein